MFTQTEAELKTILCIDTMPEHMSLYPRVPSSQMDTNTFKRIIQQVVSHLLFDPGVTVNFYLIASSHFHELCFSIFCPRFVYATF